jgi:histidine phosphotransferase ChpT
MTRSIELRVLDLLAAKLCHDLVGPVAAIANGVELLGEDDPEFVKDAVALVGESARKANRCLQFYRFAYGFSGGGLTGPAPHQLAAEFFEETAIACDYSVAARALPPEEQKLACAMLAVAGEGLPRGGRLVLDLGAAGLEVEAFGQGVGPSPEARAALTLATPVAELTTRMVGAYLAGLLAEAHGLRLTVADRPGGFRLLTAVGAPP